MGASSRRPNSSTSRVPCTAGTQQLERRLVSRRGGQLVGEPVGEAHHCREALRLRPTCREAVEPRLQEVALAPFGQDQQEPSFELEGFRRRGRELPAFVCFEQREELPVRLVPYLGGRFSRATFVQLT
jgi:hypothetical protein